MVRALSLRPDRAELAAAAVGVLLAAAAGAAVALPEGPLGAGRGLAVLLAAVAAVVTVADLRAGLVIVVLSLALPVPVVVFGFDVHPAHVFIVLFAIRAAAEAWMGRTRIRAAVLLPALVVLFGAVIASVAGPLTAGSAFRFMDVFAIPLLGLVAVASVFDVGRDLRALVLSCAAALTIVSFAAVLQTLGYAPGALAPVEPARANALFEHPNVLGGFIAPLLIALTAVAVTAWKRVPLPLITLAAPLALGAAGLIATLSRGALLGVGAGLVVMIVLLISQRRAAALLGLLLVIVAILFVAVPRVPESQRAEFADRLQQLLKPGSETGRELTFRQALRMIGDYPYTGVGPLTFGQLTRESTPIPDIEPGREHAHNLFLEGYLSLGPLGLLGLLWFVAGAMWRYLQRGRRAVEALVAGWSVGAVAALAAMLVQGGGDFIFSNLEPLGLLALLVGVGYAFGRTPQAPAAA
jgi:O-antigen ligase